MVADQQSHWFHKVREDVAVAVTPIQYAVNAPIEFVDGAVSDVSSKHALLDENAKLKTQLLLLQAKMQKTLSIESENHQLMQLLQASAKAGGRVLQAEILAVSPNPALHQVIIDKGSTQGVYLGQPVLDAYGIMGQVVQLGPLSSRILLLTDSQSAIPIEDSRSGVRAIAAGNSHLGELELMGITRTSNVKKGDLLISSGLGQRYPYGYPVGTVSRIDRNTSGQFSRVFIRPSAHIQQSRLVLLVWPMANGIDKTIKQGMINAGKAQTNTLKKQGGA